MHKNALLMFNKYALPEFRPADSVLEVGPSRGNTLWRDAMPAPDYHYADLRNFDIGPGRVVMSDPYRIDAADKTFDVVIAGQVIEHVAEPWTWMKELARVTSRALIIIAPVSYQYHPGKGIDGWRIFSDGMAVLLLQAGLTVKLAVHESLDSSHTDTIGIGVTTEQA